ncbi:MAG: branched-chain amino acid ABC transporter permease [Clostridiales Family XIII bacterium]|jgi:branched-chain amino acid transport system permease protein|nr:branched-chain amino acid ABC transporter permease [Clostridiales Family XIII bacterium]
MDLIKNTFWNPKKHRIGFFAVVCATIILAFCPAFTQPYTTILLASILMYVIMSLAWTIFSGKTGYISLASAAFYGLGVYGEAILGSFIPLPLVMVLSAGLCFCVAFGIGAITLRLRGVYFTIFTFGLALLLQNFVLWFEIKFYHTKGRMVVPYEFRYVFYCILVVFVVSILVAMLMKQSGFGLALDCIGLNEDSAAHAGVNTTMYKILAFAISAAPVGAVGAAMATRVGYIDPGIAFNMLMSFMPVLMAIFGGTHNICGPILGAVALSMIEEILIRNYQEYYMIILGLIMVVAIILMPKGIVGMFTSVIEKRGKLVGGGAP